MSNQVELVVTLPQTVGPEMAHLAHARTTLGALTQLAAQAQEELIIATPYIRGDILGQSVLQAALQHAVEERKVDLSVASTGGTLDRISGIGWIASNRSRVHLFCPKSNLDSQSNLGSHAKFCIADRKTAYIGSANLTYLGLHEHLEMGVLVTGDIVDQVLEFWRLLISSSFLVEEGNA